MTTHKDETLSGAGAGAGAGAGDNAADRGTLSDLLAVHGYRPLCVSSFLWHTTRWGGLFSTSYLLTQIANSPLLNQVAGALIFAPMLVGGLFAGIVSDRFDRRRLLLAAQLTLIPISLLMFVAVQSGQVRVWMTFPFMFAVGIGGLLNMTAQRPLIYETVGDRLAARALTIETTAQAAAAVVATLLGGVLIEEAGIGASFAGMAILLCLSAALLRVVPSPQAAGAGSASPVSMASQVRASAELVRRSRRLVALLGVTVIQNVFYFSFTPIVPVVAKQFGASAVIAGALSAAAGCGQIAAGALLSSRHISGAGSFSPEAPGSRSSALSVFASAPLLRDRLRRARGVRCGAGRLRVDAESPGDRVGLGLRTRRRARSAEHGHRVASGRHGRHRGRRAGAGSASGFAGLGRDRLSRSGRADGPLAPNCSPRRVGGRLAGKAGHGPQRLGQQFVGPQAGGVIADEVTDHQFLRTGLGADQLELLAVWSPLGDWEAAR